MRVLVVDDEDAARYLIASLLKGHGYEVIEAVDGRDALAKARATDVDIIITDILMPNMDGYQLCREWKADEKLAEVPLVFYSATYTEPADDCDSPVACSFHIHLLAVDHLRPPDGTVPRAAVVYSELG